AEVNILKFNFAFGTFIINSSRICNVRLGIEYPENKVCGNHPHLQGIELICNLAQRPKKHFGILNKCDNKTQRYGSPANYIQPAVPHHQTSCYSSSHFRNWKEYGVVPNGANPRFSVVGVYFLEAFVFSFFSGENLYYFHSRNTFL